MVRTFRKMRRVEVRGPDLRLWRVGRRWSPWHVVLTSPLAGIGVFFAEWMLALLLIPIAVAYRLVFHRPWHLSAASADGRDVFAVAAEGWTESERMIAAAADHLKEFGTVPPDWIRLTPSWEEV